MQNLKMALSMNRRSCFSVPARTVLACPPCSDCLLLMAAAVVPVASPVVAALLVVAASVAEDASVEDVLEDINHPMHGC